MLRAMPNLYKNPWFNIKKPVPNASMRLFCFPYAGGSAQIFQDWCDSLPAEIEVIGIQYPGRGSRFIDPLISSTADMVSAILPQIMPVLDKPFVFFGHSNGALVSFELARALQAKGVRQQTHHFLSAKRAIHLPYTRKPMCNLPDDEFVVELENLGGTPTEILAQKELMELFMPILRADFSLSETFSYPQGDKLQCEATLMYGEQDEDVPTADVMSWQDLIESKVSSKSFSGGHFFVNSQKEEVLSFLNERLTSLLQSTQYKMLG
jgi:medium-chain acyl-[acyl-carrier-protein] hydrolase